MLVLNTSNVSYDSYPSPPTPSGWRLVLGCSITTTPNKQNYKSHLKHWNRKANSFVFTEHSRHLDSRSKREFETKKRVSSEARKTKSLATEGMPHSQAVSLGLHEETKDTETD